MKNKKLLFGLGLFFVAIVFSGCALLNSEPVFESDPVTTAKEGVAYAYDVEATDPNGDTLEFSLLVHPTGMTINSITGVISWKPTEAQIGAIEVVVEVSDGSKSATQTFTIGVDITFLASIEVLPTSISIAAGSSKKITSVTALYDNGTSESIALTDCTYESNNAKITVANGVITVLSTCTATTGIITVSHTEDGVTKNDKVTITVPAPAPALGGG